jgi:hypothetical protein
LYGLWRYAVEETPADNGLPRLAVHLRLSVETPRLRVVGHEPADGRVDLTATEPCRVALRLPTGATQAIVLVGGEGERCVAPLLAAEGYVEFDLAASSTAQVRYPLPERVAHYEVGTPKRNQRATGHWRGDTLMRVDPPGRYLPLYGRSTDLPSVEPAPPSAARIASL